MAPKAKPKGKATAKAPEPAPKAPAPKPKAKAEPEPKAAVAKSKASPGAPVAGSGTAAVRQSRIDSTVNSSEDTKEVPEESKTEKEETKNESEDTKETAEKTKTDETKESAKKEEEAKQTAEKEESKEIDAEEHARLEALQKEEMARKAAEEEAKRKERENGEVQLNYSMYDMKFPIKDGKITAKEIDETYCLSDVMPGCSIFLSEKSPEEKYAIDSAEEVFPVVLEEPPGTFIGLEADSVYYVFVTQDPTELKKSQEKAKEKWKEVKEEKVRGEGCSCLEGNPCVDEYICTDWHNRFALARKNGWIGYQAM